MLLKLPIMLLSSAPNQAYYAQNYAQWFILCSVVNVKFNWYWGRILVIFALIVRYNYIMHPLLWNSSLIIAFIIWLIKTITVYSPKFFKMSITFWKCALPNEFAYYAGIMHDAFAIQNFCHPIGLRVLNGSRRSVFPYTSPHIKLHCMFAKN